MSLRTGLLLLVTAVSAACGLIVEITAGRMIAPYLGMSLYTWTAIIAVVLAGFSVGHWIGGRVAEQPVDACQQSIAWSLLLAGISSAASLLLLRLLSGPVISLGLGPVPTILCLTTLLFFLPSLFVGIPSPPLTRLAIEENTQRLGHILGIFYAAGALGSIIGTLAAGYIFISWLGTTGTILTVAVTYAILAGLMFTLTRRGKGRTVNALMLPLAATAGATLLLGIGGNKLLAFQSGCDVESDYYCIRIIDLEQQIGISARSMVLDHLEHGVNVAHDPQLLLAPYVETQDALARLHRGTNLPFRAFFIGGGAYTLPRAWLASRKHATVHVAELDPQVTRAARDRMWLDKSDRLTVIHSDARRALNVHEGAPFNVIVGDAFHDISVPQHLVTREFFALVKSRLADNGIYLMNVVDHRDRPRLALSIVRSLEASFDVVEMWRAEPAGERATFVIVAATAATSRDMLQSRVSPGQSFVRLSSDRMTALTNRLKPFVLTDDYAPVDRLISVR